MAINVRVFDPTTGNSRTISVELIASIVIQDLDADYDYFLRLSTKAKTVNGGSITNRSIRSLSDGASGGGTTKHDGSALPYSSMTESINDHIWDMVDGTIGVPSTAMSFTL